MSNFPNFDHHGYQVIQQLGHNYQGGRVTYKAISLNTQQPVVIKQFRFATGNSDWSGNKAVEREIQVLRSLKHPGIPRYLDSFDPENGLCLVQDYKNAQPLSLPRSFDPDEIKTIAIKVLEILVYLQNRIPIVIHRDIKPENVLLDEQLNVYLVDFGFARIGDGEVVALSSMVAGTTGFMPPEQLLNRPLTASSDLYGLGATLICLLTGTKSVEITNLIDSSFRINFKHLVPKLSFRFIEWLQKMVQPNFNDRFANAEVALEALKPLYIVRTPDVKISHSSLEFKASRLDGRLTQTITVSNSIPETVLEGTWEVAPHLSDSPHTPETHAWIKIAPANFASNHATCRVTVDVSQLMADKTYERQILLHTNSATETYCLAVKVQTAAIPIATVKPPYFYLAILGGLFFSLVLLVCRIWLVLPSMQLIGAISMFLVLAGTLVEAVYGGVVENVFKLFENFQPGANLKLPTGIGSIIICLIFFQFIMAVLVLIFSFYVVAIIILILILVGAFPVFIAKKVRAELKKKGFSKVATIALLTLTMGLGTSLGVWINLGSSNTLALTAVLATGLPLAGTFLYLPLQRRKLVAKYRQSEQHLIKP